MSNKNKLFIILGIIVLIVVSFIVGLLIGQNNVQKTNSPINKNDNSVPLQIEIQEVVGSKTEAETKKYTLTQEEIYTFFNIINNITFSNVTCDGLPKYIISYNSDEKENLETYAIETYNTYHIKSR